MYNFNEIKNLNELKELCFYIKAINEARIEVFKYENMGQIKDYLKNEYNLEISVSKLYLFVQKILSVYNKDKFPEENVIDDILKSYVANIRKKQRRVEKELEVAELNIRDPKHKITKGKFVSTEQLADDIVLKRKMFARENNILLAWAGVFGVFLISILYCVIGIGFPELLRLYVTKVQEVVLVLLSICVLSYIIYWLLYFINHEKMDSLKVAIDSYYKYELVIKNDILLLNTAKQNLYAFKNQLSINGIEMTDDAILSFLRDSDAVDIKYYNTKINAKSLGRELKLNASKPAQFGQVISKHEQDMLWQDSEESKKEKEFINKELIARVNVLAECLNNKAHKETSIISKMSDLYCNELSVAERQKLIDNADSKIQLLKNYCNLIDKLHAFAKTAEIDINQYQQKEKSKLQVSEEERASFNSSLLQIFKRIAKADSLNMLSSGQSETYKRIQKELDTGVIQGVQIDAVAYRYDLAKLYIRLYDELSTYDILN